MVLGWSKKAARWVVACALAVLAVPLTGIAEAAPTPTPIPQDAHWLTTVNYYRQMAGLPPVTEDPGMSYGSTMHSCYMLTNGISHDEVAGLPGYTPEGDDAGNAGNVAVTSVAGTSARTHIELWMTGPFHAIGVLRPNLQRVGFGKCDDPNGARWKSGATLDVIRGLGPSAPLTAPILFPGNGTTTNLDRFVVETPNPKTFCGWSPNGGAGLPILAQMPESVAGAVSAQIVGPNGPLETCTLSQNNTTGVAQILLKGNNVVVAMTPTKLEPGTYTVTITTPHRVVTWSFTVDPNVANGTATPAPAPKPPAPTPAQNAVPSGPESGFLPMSPVRLADSREGNGTGTLPAGVPVRVQLGGRGGLPTSPEAVSANFTVTNPAGAGFLTAWNCSADRPVVASLNFGAGETVANAASVPLDESGGLCLFSPVRTDVVIDVNGYYAGAATNKFSPIVPARLMDTRIPMGPSGRLAQGQTVTLQVTGTAGIPATATAVALNVASVYPDFDGYVTVWPCDRERPFTASLNPKAGAVKPNLVLTPVSASGTVCLFSSTPVDLVVDVTGYLSADSASMFTPSAPFRFTDTREATQPKLHAGTGGARLGGGRTLTLQMAGERGIPADATAVSVNIAVTDGIVAGFVTAWPCDVRQPNTANVNFAAQVPTSNGAQVPLSADGTLCVYTNADAHIVVDVNGWWA